MAMVLDQIRVHELVLNNNYPSSSFISRSFEARYPYSQTLPALAIPGADIGDLAVLAATATIYGFEVHLQKALACLSDVVGGEHNISHVFDDYIQSLSTNCKAYNVTEEQMKELTIIVEEYKKKGPGVKLTDERRYGAILQLRGEFGVHPQYTFKDEGSELFSQVYVYHQGLLNKRHRLWAQKLVEKGAVSLYDNLDEEYLYEVLSSTSEDHFLQIVQEIAKTLPIFEIDFAQDGTFKLEEQGFVSDGYEASS